MGLERLQLLTRRALRFLRLYAPTDASVTVAALGDLGCDLGVSPSVFFANLVPALPHYDASQLSRLFAGLSKLHIAHYMTTAYILKLSLSSLRKGAFLDTGCKQAATEVTALAPSAEQQISVIIAIARALQTYHTQRTLRAFLAATERALIPYPLHANNDDAGAVSMQIRRAMQVEVLERHSPSSCTTLEEAPRQSALKALVLLEVYVSGRVDVQAPHTPRWLVGVLGRVPLDAFTLKELLHVYNRVFPMSAGTCALPLLEAHATSPVLRLHLSLLRRIVVMALRQAEAGACRLFEMSATPFSREVTPEKSPAPTKIQPNDADVWKALTHVEKGTLLHCTVSFFVQFASETEKNVEGTGCWEPKKCLTFLHLLSRQAQWENLPTPTQARLQFGLPVQHFINVINDLSKNTALISQRALSGDALVAVSLLQMIYTDFMQRDGGGAVCAPRARTTHEAVMQLCGNLEVLSAAVSCHGVDRSRWELLALLLAPDAELFPQGRFSEWLRDTLLLFDDTGATWIELASLWRRAVSFLLGGWCRFWTRASFLPGASRTSECGCERTSVHADLTAAGAVWSVRMKGESSTGFCTSAVELSLHWCIADLTEAALTLPPSPDSLSGIHSLMGLSVLQRGTAALEEVQPVAPMVERVWRELLHHTMHVAYCLEADAGCCAYPTELTALDGDLLMILGNSMHRARRHRQREKKECLESLPNISLMLLRERKGSVSVVELISGKLERASRSCANNAHVRWGLMPYREALRQQRWWRRRIWCVSGGILPCGCAVVSAAATLLLRALFLPGVNTLSAPEVCACHPAESWTQWELWPYRLLVASIGGAASVTASPSSADCTEALQDTWQTLEAHSDADAIVGLGGVVTGLPPHRSGARGDGDAADARHRLSGKGGCSLCRILVPPGNGLTCAMMSSLENLFAWETEFGLPLASTLRGGGEMKERVSRGPAVVSTELYDLWYRDDSVLKLVSPSGCGICRYTAIRLRDEWFVCEGVHQFGEPRLTASEAGWETNAGGMAAQCTSGEDASSLFMWCDAVELLTGAARIANIGGHYSLSVCAPPLQPCFRFDAPQCHDDHLRSPKFSPFSAEGVHCMLRSCFWRSCRALVSQLPSNNSAPACCCDTVKTTLSESDAAKAMGVILRGAAEWDRCDRTLHNSIGASMTASSAHLSVAVARERHETMVCLSAATWRILHAALESTERTPALVMGEEGTMAQFELELLSLDVLVSFLCSSLPLDHAYASAHERLWCCLQAALLNTSALPRWNRENPGDVWMSHSTRVSRAMVELRGCIQERRWFLGHSDRSVNPYRSLRKIVGAVCDDRVGMTDSIAATEDEERHHDASPAEKVLTMILPRHPFFAETPTIIMERLSAVRLVLLTWLHIVMMQLICVYHPPPYRFQLTRIEERGDNGGMKSMAAQVRTLQERLARYGERLNHGVLPTTPSTKSPATSSLSCGLLELCLLREFDASLTDMMRWGKRGPRWP